MPRIHKRKLKQKAVLWAYSGTSTNNTRYGEVTVSSPVEINCRWEEDPKVITGPDGQPKAVDGIVYVAQEIEPGSLLRLGAKIDLPNTVNSGIVEVISCSEIPSIKGDRSRYERACLIKNYQRSLPTVV